MTSRDRVRAALQHREADRIPVDFGACATTGIHVGVVYQLRQAYGLDTPGTPVKVTEPYQMLGEIAPDLMDCLGIDVVGLSGPRNLFGFANEGWKEWRLNDGTPVLVPRLFNIATEPNGDVLQYPEGDKTAPPSGRMPAGGFYFDSLIRQPPIDDDHLDPNNNLEEFTPITDADLNHFAGEADRLYKTTDKAILANFGGTAFGDIALVPAPFLKNPKGIRDIEEWYVSTVSRQDYVHAVFSKQCETGIANLARIHDKVGNKIDAVFTTGADFGTQNGPFLSTPLYRSLFMPYHKAVNDWIHAHTTWKAFIHSCGSIQALIPDFIEAGFDILNPVQCSAMGMEPQALKSSFGAQLVFWGGGVDTQKTLPFGTPEAVAREVESRIRIFGRNGGFVYNAIHNIQAKTPTANLMAMFDTLRKTGIG